MGENIFSDTALCHLYPFILLLWNIQTRKCFVEQVKFLESVSPLNIWIYL